jgi:PAS domain S-box-containing protein
LLQDEFAAVLLDVELPEMGGFEVATTIKSRGRAAGLPILFLTRQNSDPASIERAYTLGAVDYLPKPVVAAAVRSKVALFAEVYRQRKRIEEQSARIVHAERTEGALRLAELRLASERRYRALANVVPHIVWTARPDGSVDYFNQRWFEYTGLSARDAEGTWLGAVHPEDRERCRTAWQVSLESGDGLELECRLRAAHDGTYRWQLARALPELATSGEIAAWLGTFTDIEEQKRAGEVLAEFKGTLDAVHDAVFIVDATGGRVLYANDGAGLLLGRPRDEILQMRMTDFLVDYDEPRMRDLVAPLDRASGKSSLEEARCRRKDGSEIPIEVLFQLIRSDGGRVVAIGRDISGRKLAELERQHLYEEAVAAVRARDEFLTIASHELRGPLSALELRLASLVRGLSSNAEGTSREQVHARAAAAAKQADRLAQLVGELLDVSRITAGKLRLDRRSTDLAGLARDVVARFQEEAHRAGSTVEVHAPDPVVGVWDPLRVEQVVTNLVSNALKFGEGKPIEVTISRAGPNARAAVRDHGIGIAHEDLDRVFHRFERTAQAATYAGLGMGLYIARQIVEAHGGKIHVESEPNLGSTFVADLPLETPSSDAHSTTAHHSP